MKVCCNCRKNKGYDKFGKRKQSKDGLMSRCKECQSIYQKDIYKSSDKRKIQIYLLNKKTRERNREWIRKYKENRSCLDCKNNNWIVLEFDHLFDKKLSICSMVNQGFSLETIQKEIDKCEIVCSNCHSIRTYNRLNNIQE